MPRTRKLKELTSWDWETLVASWRYYEHGSSIASVMFPADIIERYFGIKSKYSFEAKEKIAYQYAKNDHGLRGEKDWKYDLENGEKIAKMCATPISATLKYYDVLPWLQFLRFCEWFCANKPQTIDEIPEDATFHVDLNDGTYLVKNYVCRPRLPELARIKKSENKN